MERKFDKALSHIASLPSTSAVAAVFYSPSIQQYPRFQTAFHAACNNRGPIALISKMLAVAKADPLNRNLVSPNCFDRNSPSWASFEAYCRDERYEREA